jgi:putative DNA primase/helicase
MVSPEQLARAKSVSLLSLLDKDKVLKKAGSGYMLACEWHEDSDPSMSLFKGSDGNWRYFCHGCGAKGDTVRYLQVKKGMTFVDAVNYLTAEAKSAPAKPIVAATYDYCSAEGELLYQVLRYQPKDFRVRRPTQNGWAWNLKDIKRVLYRLPELLEATKEPGKTIYVVEGEKDCDNLRKLGYCATTHAGGAGAYRKELLSSCRPSNTSLLSRHGRTRQAAYAARLCRWAGHGP